MSNQLKFKLDGYGFGDRLLEGVYFDVVADFDKGEVISVTVAKDCEAYFSQLNQETWLAEVYMKADDIIDDIKVHAAKFGFEYASYIGPDGTLEF